MPHLRDVGFDAGLSADDAPDAGARVCFADRDDECSRDAACFRDDAHVAPLSDARHEAVPHPHD